MRKLLSGKTHHITQHISMTTENLAKQWLFVMMETLGQEAFVEMAATLWAIWYVCSTPIDP
jgi:hypothetical protein